MQRELDAASVFVGSGRDRRCTNKRDPKRIEAVKRLARAKEREANARRDYAHNVARTIVNGADVIALEALRLRNMTRSAKGTAEVPGRNVAAKARLNRVVLDAGFGLLDAMIVAKAEEAARTVVRVNPSRRKRHYVCVGCGFTCHAVVNAALVIWGRGQSVLMSERTAAEDAGRRKHDVAA